MTLDQVGIFADGVAVRSVGAVTFDLARRTVDEVFGVPSAAPADDSGVIWLAHVAGPIDRRAVLQS